MKRILPGIAAILWILSPLAWPANTASLLDLTSNAVVLHFVVGSNPDAVAWAGNGSAFVVNEFDATLVRLDMTKSPPTISATFTFPSGFVPHTLAIDPAGTRALVASDLTARVFLLDLTATPFSVLESISVPVTNANGMAFYSSGTRAAIVNEANLLFLDMTTTPAGMATVALGTPGFAVAVNTAGTRAVVSLDGGGLQVVDLTSSPPSLLGLPLGPGVGNADSEGVAISPDGNWAIYLDESTPASEANVIDLRGTPTFVRSVPLSLRSPSGIAFNPASGAALISGDDGVAILNPPYTGVSASIADPGFGGTTAFAIAVNPAGTQAIVLNEDTPTAGPLLFVSPTQIDFGPRNIGSTSLASFSVTNIGLAALFLGKASISPGAFAIDATDCPLASALPAGSVCRYLVSFTPAAPGNFSALVTIVGDSPGTSQQIVLTGIGNPATSPAISVSPDFLVFGSVVVNTASAPQIVTVNSTGTAPLRIVNFAAFGPFQVSTDCGLEIPAGSHCQMQVVFTPTALGHAEGQLSIFHSASGSFVTIPLTGSAIPAPRPRIQLSAGTLSFGPQLFGTPSTAQELRIRSTGTAPLFIQGITSTEGFVVTTTCPASLDPDQECVVRVTFAPRAFGRTSGILTVASSDPEHASVSVGLAGTGCRPQSGANRRSALQLCSP